MTNNTEKMFVADIVDDFKKFVMASMDEGHHKNFDDHIEFLATCFEQWEQLETSIKF